MLTRNKKKRTAGKGKSCPENSNQKHSTDPGYDAVEVGEMPVRIDHGGTSGVLDDDCPRTIYRLQVAWLLREKLNDLVDGDKPGEFLDLGLQSLLDMAASRNIVSVDPKMLNPVLWRTLPKELLLHVVARLPVPDITRLRSLSREWRRDLATANSGINQACYEVSPIMVALLSHSSTDAFLVTIYDITKCRWLYDYRLHLRRPWNVDWQQCPLTWTGMDAFDGGLVCFISLRKPTKEDRLCIVVVNLLTRVQHELPPPHYQYSLLPAMVQIKVDSDTKCYKVFVAAYLRGRLTVEMYDSGTRQWTRAAPSPPCGSIFGPVHCWTSANGWCSKLLNATPGSYDFAKGKLERYYRKDIRSTRGCVIDSVLVKDRMFLFEGNSPRNINASHPYFDFGISEHHLDNQTKAWVKWKSYDCPPFEKLVTKPSAVSLRACDGFLMVIVYRGRKSPVFWLLDLSTSEWSTLPEHSTKVGLHKPGAVLCRVFWNVIP